MRYICTIFFINVSLLLHAQSTSQDLTLRPCKKTNSNDSLNNLRVTSVENALSGKMGCGIVVRSDKVVKPGSPVVIRLRCGNGFEGTGGDPVYVVEGKIVSNINDVNRIDIEDITILQQPAAQAIYGSAGKNGAIVITLKKKYHSFIIKDKADNSSVSNATVSFVFPGRSDTLRYIADDSGMIVTNSFNELKDCRMIVSSAGYITQEGIFSFLGMDTVNVVYLERDIKNCVEAVIACYDCSRTIRCGGFRVSITTSKNLSGTNTGEIDQSFAYPNPAKAGQIITLRHEFRNDELVQVKVTDAGGKLVTTQHTRVSKGINRLTINSDLRWQGGVYFFKVMYANGRIAASGKIIIQ